MEYFRDSGKIHFSYLARIHITSNHRNLVFGPDCYKGNQIHFVYCAGTLRTLDPTYTLLQLYHLYHGLSFHRKKNNIPVSMCTVQWQVRLLIHFMNLTEKEIWKILKVLSNLCKFKYKIVLFHRDGNFNVM